jgi:hypothetical protein
LAWSSQRLQQDRYFELVAHLPRIATNTTLPFSLHNLSLNFVSLYHQSLIRLTNSPLTSFFPQQTSYCAFLLSLDSSSLRLPDSAGLRLFKIVLSRIQQGYAQVLFAPFTLDGTISQTNRLIYNATSSHFFFFFLYFIFARCFSLPMLIDLSTHSGFRNGSWEIEI